MARVDHALQLRAAFAPDSFNAETRTVEVVWSTGAQVKRNDPWGGGSFIEELSLAPQHVRMDRLNNGAPLLNSHASHDLADVIGVVERAWLAGNEARATVRFSERPEIAPVLADVKSGVLRNISVGYRIHKTERDESGAIPIERAVDWEPFELSLVPVPADAGAQVRSDQAINSQEINVTTNTNIDTEPPELRGAHLKRFNAIIDFTPAASRDEVRALAAAEGLDAAYMHALDLAAAEQAKTACHRRTSEPGDEFGSGSSRSALGEQIQRAMDGERLAEPLWLQLRRHGVPGSNPGDVFMNWFEGRQDPMATRGMLTTTDAPRLLLGSGDRLLQKLFNQPQGGIMAAATIEQFSDFRGKSIIDVGLVGGARKVLEGGEVHFTALEESGISYKPARWESGIAASVEALANDDLGGLRQAIAELGNAAQDAERTELVNLLEGTANGGPCADGAALFHSSHKNTVASGPIDIAKLGEAVALLRGQKTVGGRHVDQQPAAIICGLGAELTLRQLLSSAVVPNAQSAVNPWASLSIEVDPRIGNDYCYLISAGPRMPLQLGRLYPAPRISDEVQFSTGAYRVKASHAFGVCVAEYRAIVRVKLAA